MYNSKLKIGLSLIIVILLVWGCKKKDPEPDEKAKQFVFKDSPFLAINNTWYYNTYDWTTGDDGVFIVEVLQLHPDYTKVYKVKQQQDQETPKEFYWFMHYDTLMTFELNEDIQQADPVYILNTKKGDTWSGTDGGTNFTYTTVTADSVISLGYGDVVCNVIEVESSNSFVAQKNYWNDTIGLFAIGNISMDIELDSINF